jgi:hypothetical protein
MRRHAAPSELRELTCYTPRGDALRLGSALAPGSYIPRLWRFKPNSTEVHAVRCRLESTAKFKRFYWK